MRHVSRTAVGAAALLLALSGCTLAPKAPAPSAPPPPRPVQTTQAPPAPTPTSNPCFSLIMPGKQLWLLRVITDFSEDTGKPVAYVTLLESFDEAGILQPDNSILITLKTASVPGRSLEWQFVGGVSPLGAHLHFQSGRTREIGAGPTSFTAPAGEVIDEARICGTRPVAVKSATS